MKTESRKSKVQSSDIEDLKGSVNELFTIIAQLQEQVSKSDSAQNAKEKSNEIPRLQINLRKMDVALLFILLVGANIIKPKSIRHLYSFIEAHFQYTNTESVAQESCDIKRIASEFSRLQSQVSYYRNKENQEKAQVFIETLKDELADVADKLKYFNLYEFGALLGK